MIRTSVPAICSNGTIFIGSCDNNLHAINSDGTKKWRVETVGDIFSSPVINFDGTIYVGSEDYSLYAINSDCGSLANTSWPMFLHDIRHTGKSE